MSEKEKWLRCPLACFPESVKFFEHYYDLYKHLHEDHNLLMADAQKLRDFVMEVGKERKQKQQQKQQQV
jgi:hypothetical protein